MSRTISVPLIVELPVPARCPRSSRDAGTAHLARDDVEDDGAAKAEEEEAAQHHQHGFEPIEGAPLEVTLPLQQESFGGNHDRSVQTIIPTVVDADLSHAVMAGLVPAIHVFETSRK